MSRPCPLYFCIVVEGNTFLGIRDCDVHTSLNLGKGCVGKIFKETPNADKGMFKASTSQHCSRSNARFTKDRGAQESQRGPREVSCLASHFWMTRTRTRISGSRVHVDRFEGLPNVPVKKFQKKMLEPVVASWDFSVKILFCDWLEVLLNLAAVQRGAETSGRFLFQPFPRSRRKIFYNISTASKRRPELPQTKLPAVHLLLRSYPQPTRPSTND